MIDFPPAASMDNRLGEAMVFSGVAGAVRPALEKYENSLSGGYIPIPLNLEAVLHASPETPVVPTPKSATQRGRDALASMAASSSTAPNLPEGSWMVNKRGEIVRKGEEQVPVHDQFPVPPQQESTGTARVIGFPAPPKAQQEVSQGTPSNSCKL